MYYCKPWFLSKSLRWFVRVFTYTRHIYLRLRSTPILKSMADFYLTEIYLNVLFSKWSNLRFFQICIQCSNLWRFLTFSNRRPMTPLTYAHPLTNKSSIVWEFEKDPDLRIPLNLTVISDNDVSGCRFEEWTQIWVRTLIWIYHI